jgi:hypothetical protein
MLRSWLQQSLHQLLGPPLQPRWRQKQGWCWHGGSTSPSPAPALPGAPQAGSSAAAAPVQHQLDASHTADAAPAEAAFIHCKGDFEGAFSMLRERMRMVELIRQLYPVSGTRIAAGLEETCVSCDCPDGCALPASQGLLTLVYRRSGRVCRSPHGRQLYVHPAYQVQLANQLHHALPLYAHAERTLKVSLAIAECSFSKGCMCGLLYSRSCTGAVAKLLPACRRAATPGRGKVEPTCQPHPCFCRQLGCRGGQAACSLC